MRALIPYLAYLYVSFVGLTTRLKRVGTEHHRRLRERNKRFIYAFWHEQQVFFTWTHRDDNVSVLVSLSKDGELIARTMALSGIGAARGSSSRGAGEALRALTREVECGRDIGITPDGPKGPRRVPKSGALYLARELGIPILPTANALERKLVLQKSWDKFQVPLPFGKAVLAYGEPLNVGIADDLDEKARELQKRLDDLTVLAERELAT